MSRNWGETFKRFMACMAIARQGKTFIYIHPEFVAIDQKTWAKIQRKLNPPKEILFYDEVAEWTPEQSKLVDKWLSKPSSEVKNGRI